jgi:hypothetical protein
MRQNNNTAEDTLEGKGPFDKISTPLNGAVTLIDCDWAAICAEAISLLDPAATAVSPKKANQMVGSFHETLTAAAIMCSRDSVS